MSKSIIPCAEHLEPDLWFPELGSGTITTKKLQNLSSQIDEAIGLCNQCPMKSDCLEIGMQEENITYGIWGGTLPGQRVETLGLKREEYAPQSEKGKALDFLYRMKPWLVTV